MARSIATATYAWLGRFDARQVSDLPAPAPLPSGSPTRGQRPPVFREGFLRKSETCRLTEWQSLGTSRAQHQRGSGKSKTIKRVPNNLLITRLLPQAVLYRSADTAPRAWFVF
jgi:hypothetical protein